MKDDSSNIVTPLISDGQVGLDRSGQFVTEWRDGKYLTRLRERGLARRRHVPGDGRIFYRGRATDGEARGS
jgi:hypothetical protein